MKHDFHPKDFGQSLLSEDFALLGLAKLFNGASLITTAQIQKRGDITEAGASYYLSKEALSGLRQLLALNPALIEALVERLDERFNESKTEEAPAP